MNLSPTEQADLVATVKGGDQKAARELLAFVERDIQGMLRKEKCSAADKQDLAQVGRMAVLKAVQTFDGDAGKQFRFYAAEWAREDIRRHATVLSSIVVRNVHTRGSDIYLDAPTKVVGRESCYLETLDSGAPSAEELLAEFDEGERLRQVLESIIRRMRQQAEAKYDRLGLARSLVYDRLLSHDPVKLGTLAERFGVVRETARKLERAILAKAQTALQGA